MCLLTEHVVLSNTVRVDCMLHHFEVIYYLKRIS